MLNNNTALKYKEKEIVKLNQDLQKIQELSQQQQSLINHQSQIIQQLQNESKQDEEIHSTISINECPQEKNDFSLKINVISKSKKENKQRKEAIESFKLKYEQNNGIIAFYNQLNNHIESIFISCKSLAGGYVSPVESNLSKMGGKIVLAGDLLSLIPTVGKIFPLISKYIINTPLTFLDKKNQKEIVQIISSFGTLKTLSHAAEIISRKITEHYKNEILFLNHKNKFKKIEVLSAFLMQQMIDLINSKKINPKDEITDQIISHITKYPSEPFRFFVKKIHFIQEEEKKSHSDICLTETYN